MRRAALGKRLASFVGKLSAFTLVRPMRRSTVRSPLGKDRKMEQGGDQDARDARAHSRAKRSE